jgi:AcrR family transcriptional regulator
MTAVQRRADSGHEFAGLPPGLTVADALAPRDRIVTALARLIEEKGYLEVGVRDIAQAADVSFRSFYREFPDKEACFVELQEILVDGYISVMIEAVAFEGPWQGVIRRACRAGYEALTVAPLLTRAVLLDAAASGEPARWSRERAMEHVADVLSALVEQGRLAFPEIELRPLSSDAARAVIGTVIELLVHRLPADHGEVSTDELATTAATLLMALIGPDVEPAPGRDRQRRVPHGR